MASLDRLTALSDAHAKQRDSIIEKLVKALLALWAGVDRVDDHFLTVGFAARSATLTQAALTTTRRSERSYLTAQLRELGVSTANLPQMLDGPARINADPLDVWERPVGQWIWQRREGATLELQRQALQDRVADIAGADVLTAARDEASNVYASRVNVSGYRRVIHPELSRSGTCGLCIVASQRIYHSADLMPLHGPSCNCDTMAITRTDDPGFRLNEDDLKSIYAAAGSNAAAELANTRITIDEHGELGPILVKEGDHFRDAREAGRPQYVRPTQESIDSALLRNLANAHSELEAAQANYAAFTAAHPETLNADGPHDLIAQRVGLFRSISWLTEYVKATESNARSRGLI